MTCRMLECTLFLQMKVLSMVHQIVKGKLRAQAMKCAVPLNISPGQQSQVSNVLLQQLPQIVIIDKCPPPSNPYNSVKSEEEEHVYKATPK